MPRTARRKRGRDLVTQSAASRQIGVSRPTVVAMHARGEIGGELVAGVLFLDRRDVERVAREREANSAARKVG
jgi:hypothetical protein